MFAAGCGKKNQSSETPAPPPPVAAAQPAPATPPPTVANSEPVAAASPTNGLPDLHPLNRALLDWIYQNNRRPASFEEFAASANIQIPPPPPGKKYIVDSRGIIILINR